MRLAADELEASDLVTVIDSANLSTGIGLQVVEAAVMAQAGKSAAEITGCARGIEAKSTCKLCGRYFDVFVSWRSL